MSSGFWKRRPEVKHAGLNTRGREVRVVPVLVCACIRWISVWVRLPSYTTPQSVSGKGAQRKGFTVNPNQLVAARPPTCEETEGLCQTQREWTDLTSGYSQVSCPSHLKRAKLFHHPRASRRPACNMQRCQSKIFCFSWGFFFFFFICVGKQGRARRQDRRGRSPTNLL